MKKIIGMSTFESPLRQGIMYYGSEAITFSGEVEFQVFGTAKLNGHLIKDTTIKVFADEGVLSLSGSSSVVFYKVPTHSRIDHGHYEPVPDLPDYGDDMTNSISMIVEDVLKRRGLLAESSTGFDESEDDEYDDEEEYHVSELFLVPDEDDGDAQVNPPPSLSHAEPEAEAGADADNPRVGGPAEPGGEQVEVPAAAAK